MSDFTDVCDAINKDLRENVTELFDAKSHLYEPWDPEELQATVNEKHLAIWPVAEETDVADSFTNQSHLLSQVYVILYWEGAPQEGARAKADPAGAAKMFDLHNAVRERLYLESNQTLGGSKLLWYRSTQLPANVGMVRFFRMQVLCQRIQSFS